MNELIRKLLENGPIITDGAWGTELQNRGLKSGASPEGLNLTHPEIVKGVPAAYVAAGSQIVLTNTFGANRIVQQKFKLEQKIVEMNQAAVRISKEAVGDSGALVFASIGPSGKMLIMKDVTEAELQAAFEEQAQALADAGADGLVVETMADIKEAQIAIQAAKQTGLPVVGCMTFDSGKDKNRTMMGETAKTAAEKLEQTGVDVVGSNCGQGIEGFIQIAKQMREATSLPLWMKANAGLPRFVEGKTVFITKPEEFANFVPDVIAAGANFIGGCCGTSPAFIKAVASVLHR